MSKTLTKREEAILSEGICPLCESEVRHEKGLTWRCINPDCQEGYALVMSHEPAGATDKIKVSRDGITVIVQPSRSGLDYFAWGKRGILNVDDPMNEAGDVHFLFAESAEKAVEKLLLEIKSSS